MSRSEVLYKLLKLEPMEPLHAQYVCGWPAEEFQEILKMAMQNGLVRLAKGCNGHTTRLEAI